MCNRTDETFKTFSKNVETLRAQAQLDKSKAQDNEKQLQQEINDLKSTVDEKNSKLEELMGQISSLNEEIAQYKLEQSILCLYLNLGPVSSLIEIFSVLQRSNSKSLKGD